MVSRRIVSRRKLRGRAKTQKQRGGTLYSERPDTISENVFKSNRDEEQYYYNPEPLYVKLPKEEGDERKRIGEAQKRDAEITKERRLWQIATDPSVEINETEYKSMTNKPYWELSSTIGEPGRMGGMGDVYKFYKRTAEWKPDPRSKEPVFQIRYNPDVKFTEEVYETLSDELQMQLKKINEGGAVFYVKKRRS
jgi:hypothetical protein